MSANYEKIKSYYEKGYYQDSHIRVLAVKKALTQAEYTQITGKAY